MSDEETTTEMLAEIEAQATEYTPPEGWRVLVTGEKLQAGDERVRPDKSRFVTRQAGKAVQEHKLYIRRIDEQPEPQPEKVITPDDVAAEALAGVWDQRQAEQQIEELRSEVHHVQLLLGESRQRSNKWQRLVTDLRTINDAQEKAVRAAGLENTDLQHRLDVVSKEWAEQAATINGLQQQLEAVKAELVAQAETSRRLQIELDAAQQVPADSPEIRQLWANLAEVAHDRDTYKHAHELLVQDIDATHQRTKAETVEAIAAWLEPIRREDPHLRAVILFHLPKIIRSLTGLNIPEDVD